MDPHYLNMQINLDQQQQLSYLERITMESKGMTKIDEEILSLEPIKNISYNLPGTELPNFETESSVM